MNYLQMKKINLEYKILNENKLKIKVNVKILIIFISIRNLKTKL